jgi:hypothetical protein
MATGADAPPYYPNMAPAGQAYMAPVGVPMQHMAPAPGHQVMLDSNRLRPLLIPPDGSTSRIRYMGYSTRKPLSCEYYLCGCCSPCKVSQEELRKSTYVAVYDNKIEWNEPSARMGCIGGGQRPRATCDYALCDCRCCNCFNGTVQVMDDTHVLYFDRATIQNAAVAKCCSPMCTHNQCFPDCCQCCGESLVLYETPIPCCLCSLCETKPCGVCCQWEAVNQGAYHFSARSLFDTFCNPFYICAKDHRVIHHLENAQQLADAINAAREAARPVFGPVITGLTRKEAEALPK